jgi:hypothetical protein
MKNKVSNYSNFKNLTDFIPFSVKQRKEISVISSVSKVDLNSSIDLYQRFLDLDSVRNIEISFWWCDIDGPIVGSIGLLHKNELLPIKFKETESCKDAVIGYRVYIELEREFDPNNYPIDLFDEIKLIIEKLPYIGFEFHCLQLFNYGSRSFRSDLLFSKNFDDIYKYDGIISKFCLIFKLIN